MDTIESVNDAALDLVVGGIWDNPQQDKMNQNRAAANSGDGTVGGSLTGAYYDPGSGLPAPMLGAKGTPV